MLAPFGNPYVVFALHVTCTLQNLSFAVFTLQVTCTFQNPYFVPITFHMTGIVSFTTHIFSTVFKLLVASALWSPASAYILVALNIRNTFPAICTLCDLVLCIIYPPLYWDFRYLYLEEILLLLHCNWLVLWRINFYITCVLEIVESCFCFF